MAVFVVGGREVAAELFHAQTFFLGVGGGDVAWDVTLVPPSGSTSALLDAVGVTRCREIAYVTPDIVGTITMSDGTKWSRSTPPTRYIYMEFKLDLPDAVPDYLRETAIFWGTEIDPAILPGQMFIPHADVVDYGKMIQADRFNSIVRDGTLEQSFSTIITL